MDFWRENLYAYLKKNLCTIKQGETPTVALESRAISFEKANKQEEMVLKTKGSQCCGKNWLGAGSEAGNMPCLYMRCRRQLDPHQTDSQMVHCLEHSEEPISVVISDSMTEHQETMQARLPEAGFCKKQIHERNNWRSMEVVIIFSCTDWTQLCCCFISFHWIHFC